MKICFSFIFLATCYFFALTSCFCTRGFDENDRPFINAITHKIVNRSGNISPVWSTSINGGNFLIDESDHRSSVIVPASGEYVIFVSLQNVLGTNVIVYRRRSDAEHVIAQSSIEPLGTTICGSVKYLENNDKITFLIEKGRPSAAEIPQFQLFSYLIILSVE